MIQTDPLAFLDDYSETEEPSNAKKDPLSFLDELSKTEQTTPNAAKANQIGGKTDPLSFLDEPQEGFFDKFISKPYSKTSPDKSIRQNVLSIYDPGEKTPEQLKAMSIQERMEYAQDLKNLRQLQSGTGIVKGALSGATYGGTEHIPGLKPDENDLMVGLGETLGSYLPISNLYNFIGRPLVNYAAKSPIAREGLMALARMTGFGVTGAAYKAGKDIVQGEIPSPAELGKEAATWAGIDAVLQSMGVGIAFSKAVKNIAESEGVTAKEVLGKLWDATKAKFKRPIHPDEIGLPEVESLLNEAKNAEIEIGRKEPAKPKGIEHEEKKTIEFKPKEEIAEPEVKEGRQVEAELTEAKEAAKPKETTPTTGQASFTTSKGSTYEINEDGSTTRTKAARAEHPGEEWLQPKSEKTWYVTPEDSVKLGEFQTKDQDKKIVELPNGQLGVQYTSGKDTGKIEQRTLVDFSKEPKENLIPVESWDEGKKIHFGNQITKVEKTKPVHPKKHVTEELSIPENAVLTKPESISIGSHAGKGVATVPVKKIGEEGKEYFSHEMVPVTKNENELIDASNAWSTAGDQKESSRLAQEAREMIFNRLKRKVQSGKPTVEAEEQPETLSSKTASKKPTQIPPRQTRPRQPVFGKKQAVARSKIIKLFRTAFTDPIRLGKFKQRAAGIHKLWPKVTRLLKDNDIETVAHEIGHNLHTTLYGGGAKTPQEQARNIETALKPYLDELKPLAHYEPWGMEGFAEFTRLYVTNPNVAKELAPKFYDKFENDLRAEYPEMLNALLDAREYYDAYLQGTPQSRIRAQTSYASDKGKLANIIDSIKKNLNLDNLKTQFLDDVFQAKRLVAEAFGIPLTEVENLKDERNLYRALRVLKGAIGKGDVFVLHETFNAKTLDKINGSLKDILKQLPNEEAYREFNDYLIARRALEKTAQDIETGINAGDALAVEIDLRPKYGKLAQELDRYNDTLLKYAVEGGLLSPKQYELIKKNNLLYVPFQRAIEPEKGGVASSGGKLQAGRPIKKMKGSARDIIAPIESVLKNTYSIIINAEKNLAGQTLASIAKMKNMGAFVEHVPVPTKLKGKIEGDIVAKELAKRFEREGLSDLIEYDQNGNVVLREDIADAIPEVFLRFGAGQYPAGENIITVYVQGKPNYYEVSPEIFDMWNKGIAPYSAGLLTKILRHPARLLRAGAILNPKFMMKNIVRDTWGSWLFTKYGKSIKNPVDLFLDTLYRPLAMLATSAGKGDLYVEWMKSGGSMSTMQSLDRDNVVKKLDEVRGKWQGITPIKWLKQAAEISEEANRLSEFGKALKVEGKTRLGREIAAFAARDLSIDFAKMGLQTKALNQIIPFWNATVQGGDKLLRTLANPEDRKHFLPRIIGFITIPSLMLAWLNKDDERVQEFQEQEKDFNFITFVGDQAIKIPVPFETGVLAHGLTQRMFNHVMKKDPEAFEKFFGSISDATIPNFIPTGGYPFFEIWANKNFFTGARIIPRNQEELISKYQYKRGTSSTARLLGRAMTYMLGDPDTRSKAASPEVIDHFIHSWTAGLGRLMVSISDASLEAAGLGDKIQGPGQAITEKLGLDAFTTRYPRASTRSIEKFYDLYADATARKKSLKYAEKMDLGTEEEKEHAYQRFEKIYDYNTLQNAYKAIQLCQKEINNIYNDPEITTDSKKQMIDDLYLQQIDFAKRANEDIREYRLTQ